MLQWASRGDPRLFRNSLSLPHHSTQGPLDHPRSSSGLPGNLKPVLRRISSAGRTTSGPVSDGNLSPSTGKLNDGEGEGGRSGGSNGLTPTTAEAAASAVATVNGGSGEGREGGEGGHPQRALVLERINSAPASAGAGHQRVQESTTGAGSSPSASSSSPSSKLFSLHMDFLRKRNPEGSSSNSLDGEPRGWLRPIIARSTEEREPIGSGRGGGGGGGGTSPGGPSSRVSTPKSVIVPNGDSEKGGDVDGADANRRKDRGEGRWEGEGGAEARQQSGSEVGKQFGKSESASRAQTENSPPGHSENSGVNLSVGLLQERAPTTQQVVPSVTWFAFLIAALCIAALMVAWQRGARQDAMQGYSERLEGLINEVTRMHDSINEKIAMQTSTCDCPKLESPSKPSSPPGNPNPVPEPPVTSLENGRRRLALIVSIMAMVLPVVLLHFIDQLPRLGLGFLFTGLVGEAGRPGGEEEVPLSKRLAYRVDVLFSTYSWVKPFALLTATILLISLGGFSLYAVSGGGKSEDVLHLSDAMWQAWTYVADAGNHADSKGMGPRIVSVTISFGGMLIFALMLGLVSDAISEKVDSLRKGRSEVIESRHTLVLGWSDKLGPMIKQLAVANQSVGGGVVVVLSEREKEDMESEIAKLEFDFLGTSVICRSGSPLVIADLKKVSVSTARAIIVLAEVENADQSDARALRVVLSLTGVREGLRGHIVVELSDLDNEQLVKMVGGQLVETVVAHDVIGRLMIQCARQPGLAQIWEDILGFESCEFYMNCWPELAGMMFGDVLVSFPDAIPCGVRIAADAGRIMLNPPDTYVLEPLDAVLVVAEDDNSYRPGPLPHVRKGSLPDVKVPAKMPEKILFCGWRRDIDDMITVLEAFLPPGSELWMFSEVPIEDRESRLREGGLEDLENIRIEHRLGNAVIRRHLESLPLETFDSILILADEAEEDTVMNADSRSLATLLLIRDIQSKRLPYLSGSLTARGVRQGSNSSWVRQMQQASTKSIIISEILDSRTRSLVSVSKISDYVLSNELVSMALAMVAEDREINRVLEELFAEEGNEMYIRPANLYVYDQEELSFLEVMLRARHRMEIMIGYRLENAEKAVINPPNKGAVRRWSLYDTFVVFALEE